jgi:hypothetical protein
VPSPDGAVTRRISGDVVNESPYRITNVLEIEGLNRDSASVGRTFAWVVGDIVAGGKAYFRVAPIPGSSSYRVRAMSWGSRVTPRGAVTMMMTMLLGVAVLAPPAEVCP